MVTANRVLVVDDEETIVRLVSFHLEREGFQTSKAHDGLEALDKFKNERPDMVILDLMLPSIDGLELCKLIRKTDSSTPIIMLTAKDAEVDKILGLELGADDYVTKPFSPRELVARVKALFRRSSEHGPARHTDSIHIGDLVIDSEKYQVTLRGRPVELTTKEFQLLEFMARHPGQVLTRDHLLDRVWNYSFAGDTRIVDVHVSHLREKIEDDPRNPEYIKTVRGVGYKFREKD